MYDDDIVSRALLHGLLGHDIATNILNRIDDIELTSITNNDAMQYAPAYAYTQH